MQEKWSEQLWRGIRGFQWQCTFRTWAYTIARHTSWQFAKTERKRAHRRVGLSDCPAIAEIEARVRTQTLPFLRTEARSRIAEMRDALPEGKWTGATGDFKFRRAADKGGKPAGYDADQLPIVSVTKGGKYVICGLFGGEITHPLPPFAQRAISLSGSYVGNLQELKEVVSLAKKKKLKSAPIETRTAERASEALEDLKAGRVVGRVVLDFEGVS